MVSGNRGIRLDKRSRTRRYGYNMGFSDQWTMAVTGRITGDVKRVLGRQPPLSVKSLDNSFDTLLFLRDTPTEQLFHGREE